MGPKNGGFGANEGRNLRFWFRDPQMRETTSFDVLSVKIGARVSAVDFLKNPKKVAESLGARNHASAEPKPLNRFG